MPHLRIHFTDSDIARTRIGLEADPWWEIVCSAQVLRLGDGDVSFGRWRRHVRERAVHDVDLRTALHTLLTVEPHLLARTRSAALRRVVRTYRGRVIEPYLPMIETAVRADVAAGTERYLRRGPEGVLGSLGPAVRWLPPVLLVDHPREGDLHLGGRGLLLVPCYFALLHQVAVRRALPELACPVSAESRLLAGGRGDHLTALLGATRAAILRSVVGGSTTTRLARLVGVAPATVSHHTGVLREAGLIATQRDENFARHLITPLGLRVLAAGQKHQPSASQRWDLITTPGKPGAWSPW